MELFCLDMEEEERLERGREKMIFNQYLLSNYHVSTLGSGAQ
jgi:hypothetical protein